MGKLLQIRVSAQTWDPEAVCKTWPRLCAVAEPASKTEAGSRALHDVLALTRALQDSLEFGPWSKAFVAAAKPGVKEARLQATQLEKALADWDATLANACSDRLEEALHELERTVRNAPDAPDPYKP